MWLLLWTFLLLLVNLSTCTFCKDLSAPGMYETQCQGQEDDWFASNDAYLLSATCDPVSVSVEISKNPESMYAKYFSSIDIYIIDYNCTGDDSIMFPHGVDYTLPSDSETKVVHINTTREISCIISGCVYYTSGNVYCWSHLESIAQCIIEGSTPAPDLSISSTIPSSPVSLISNISSVITQVSLLTSPAISHSASQTSVTKQSDNTPSIITEVTGLVSSMLIERPSSATTGFQLNTIAIAILVIVAVVMVTSVVSLCFVLLARRGKIHKSTGAVLEYNWRTNDEANITIHQSDRISITESLVTITQSLELTLPTNNAQILVTSEQHQATEYIIKDSYENIYSNIMAEGERQSNEDTQTLPDKMVDHCFDSSSSSHNDTMSCTSRSSTDNYIITSDANQQDKHTGSGGDEERLSNETTTLPSHMLSRHIDLGNYSDEEHFTLSNESLSQPMSNDIITELHVCLYKDKERDGEGYDSESDVLERHPVLGYDDCIDDDGYLKTSNTFCIDSCPNEHYNDRYQ